MAKIQVGGELTSIESSHKLVDAAQVKDSNRGEATQKEINDKVYDNTTHIGDLTLLETEDKDNLVGAVNKVHEKVSQVGADMGNVASLATTQKTVVPAINELFTDLSTVVHYTDAGSVTPEPTVTHVDSATKASQDGDGKVIADTYLKIANLRTVNGNTLIGTTDLVISPAIADGSITEAKIATPFKNKLITTDGYETKVMIVTYDDGDTEEFNVVVQK